MKSKRLFEAWVSAFNRGDVEALAAFYSDNAVNHQVAESSVEGKEKIKEIFKWVTPALNSAETGPVQPGPQGMANNRFHRFPPTDSSFRLFASSLSSLLGVFPSLWRQEYCHR